MLLLPIDPSSAVGMGEKKEKQHEISGPGASGPSGARGHEAPPTGYVGRCSVPQLFCSCRLLVSPSELCTCFVTASQCVRK